ncbi:unnamed protein product [Anisakis simplex]|uniref:C2H2-type domain-containing protein n=1 Tax=Anisakis simplex TaxID=6269 RepID=A0A0M3K9B1_ANISI|nr:unnamed protein product [Anisakis simplex]
MQGRFGLKRKHEAETDPGLAPFGGFLRARGVEGVLCASLLQVLAIFMVIPAPSRLYEYLKDQWAHMGQKRITQMFNNATLDRDDDDLLEALCQMRGIMLLVHPLNTGAPIKIYGQSRLVFEAAQHNGAYAALLTSANTGTNPSSPKRQKITTDIINPSNLPGPSNMPLMKHLKPTNAVPMIVTLRTPRNDNDSPATTSRPDLTPDATNPFLNSTIDVSSPPSPASTITTDTTTHTTTDCTYNLRHPRREANRLTTRPRPQEFQPTNIALLNPGLLAELAKPLTTPYSIHNNKVYCQLEGCTRRATPFATVAAWKIHVRRASCHQTNNLCTWCGHRVLVPSDLSAHQLTLRMDTHRAERCPAAPKKIVGARHNTIERLRELGRDCSHIAVPGAATADTRVGKRRNSI